MVNSLQGGHTNTWHDPVTKKPYDYGVQVFTNLSASRDFFERFNIPVGPPQFSQSQTLYADFSTGKAIDYTPPSDAQVADALTKWREQWLKYQDLLLPTSSNFPTGDDIPEDLLLTWNEFARKYDVEAVSPSIFDIVVVDLEAALMIDIWKAYAGPTRAIVPDLQPVSGDNSEVYDKAAQLLGTDVLYESQVVSAKRSYDGVQLLVKGKDGNTTEINAKRLLITVGPETLNQTVFDLDDEELDIFSSTFGNGCYTGVVSHPSLPEKVVSNTAPGAVAADYLDFPSVPALSSFNYLEIPQAARFTGLYLSYQEIWNSSKQRVLCAAHCRTLSMPERSPPEMLNRWTSRHLKTMEHCIGSGLLINCAAELCPVQTPCRVFGRRGTRGLFG